MNQQATCDSTNRSMHYNVETNPNCRYLLLLSSVIHSSIAWSNAWKFKLVVTQIDSGEKLIGWKLILGRVECPADCVIWWYMTTYCECWGSVCGLLGQTRGSINDMQPSVWYSDGMRPMVWKSNGMQPMPEGYCHMRFPILSCTVKEGMSSCSYGDALVTNSLNFSACCLVHNTRWQ